MLQSRVSTVEENCSFLEGQVRFLSVSATVGFGIYLFKLGLLTFSKSFFEFLLIAPVPVEFQVYVFGELLL